MNANDLMIKILRTILIGQTPSLPDVLEAYTSLIQGVANSNIEGVIPFTYEKVMIPKATMEQMKALLVDGKFIEAIKVMRHGSYIVDASGNRESCGLKQAKDFVDSLRGAN